MFSRVFDFCIWFRITIRPKESVVVPYTSNNEGTLVHARRIERGIETNKELGAHDYI